MTIVDTGLNTAKTSALNHFDNASHMAIGSGTAIENPTDTALDNELVRSAIDTATKDIGAGTYELEIIFRLSDGAGSTITEVGVFDASSGGNMLVREKLSSSVAKTSDFQLIVGVRVTVSASNS